jgi:hypothetical protein
MTGGKWRGGVFIALEVFDIVSFAAAAAACMHDKASAIPTRGFFFPSPLLFCKGIITLFFFCFFCLFVCSNGVLLDRGARTTAYLGNWGNFKFGSFFAMKTIMFF